MKLAGAMGVGQKWLSVHQTPLPFVLVAEDEELVRLYAADLLTEAGYKVIDVASAEAALEAMAEQPNIRVLFTDIQMPGMLDGIQLARQDTRAVAGRSPVNARARFMHFARGLMRRTEPGSITARSQLRRSRSLRRFSGTSTTPRTADASRPMRRSLRRLTARSRRSRRA